MEEGEEKLRPTGKERRSRGTERKTREVGKPEGGRAREGAEQAREGPLMLRGQQAPPCLLGR